MCGRYANTKSGDELGQYFEADEVDEVAMPPSWNISPTQRVPVVVDRVPKDDPEGMPSRFVTTARWSLVPRWATELASKYPTFNARSETASEKSTFKNAVVRSRAILPADGYYEWHTVSDALTNKPVKTPYYITDPEAPLLAFAGLYSWWRAPVVEGAEPGPWVLTATILTRASNGPTASIHDRTPVMLPREVWDEWLDPTVEGDQSLIDMVVGESESVLDRLVLHEVAPLRGDGPQLIEPIGA